MIYTGISGQEVGFYDSGNQRVYLYSISGGSYTYYYVLPATTPTPGSYGFAYANNRFFLSTSGTWYGYPLTATAPANPTSISVSVSPVCSGSGTTLTANGAEGTVYWYTGGCGTTYLTTGNSVTVYPTVSTVYYARNYNNSQYSAGCASATVTVNQPAYVPTSKTVADLQATGTGVKWYSASTGGSQLSTSTVLVNGTHYYASQTINGNESVTRMDVTASVDPTPCKPTGSASQSLSSGTTVAGLQASGSNIRWYTSSSGGTALEPSTVLINGAHYWASQTVDCTESATRLEVTVSLP
jgi:hypothetical protein